MIKKIVVLGPESTGKSSLCAQLADHYHTTWVREYARQYLVENGTEYTYENLLDIAKGQVALEEKALQLARSKATGNGNDFLPGQTGLVFIDTNMYVLKVWCEFVFGKCHPWILEQIAERKYDLYLLCDTDLPWVKDELREYPDLVTREKLYGLYKGIMENQPVPWVNIRGNYEERLQRAIAAVNNI